MPSVFTLNPKPLAALYNLDIDQRRSFSAQRGFGGDPMETLGARCKEG